MNLQQLPRPIELPTKEEWDALNKGIEYEVKFKEELFWKFYEIRDAFIPDSPEDEVIIALDLLLVQYKPCELLEVPKVA